MNEEKRGFWKRPWTGPRKFVAWVVLLTSALFVVVCSITLATEPASRHAWTVKCALIESVCGASFIIFAFSFIRWVRHWRNTRRFLFGVACFATLVAIFYAEENWRGKRAWEKCKHDLETKGTVLDWNAYIPPPVPDEQNFFKASTNIAVRFVKARTQAECDAASKLLWFRLPLYYNSYSFPVFDTTNAGPLVVAEMLVRSPDTPVIERATTEFTTKFNAPGAREQVRGLIETTIGRSIHGAAGFEFSELQFSNLAPARVVLEADATPAIADLATFIPTDTVTNIGRLRIEATDVKGRFRVSLTGVRITAAADYLKWSDQFEPAFDEIREALKRPYARVDNDYSKPYSIPIPNFVTMRTLAQTLAQRAQCHLLLGQPENALRELTLVNDSKRIVESAPASKPMTIVAAMINAAISGIYVSTIANGLQMHAWQETQLTALQAQLKNVNLLPFVVGGFNSERAAVCFTLINTSPSELVNPMIFMSGGPTNLWEKLKHPEFTFLTFAPRGWVYQNVIVYTKVFQQMLEGYDLANDLVIPSRLNSASKEIYALNKWSPYTYLDTIILPNFSRAIQAAARNHTLVNEAQIACGLERYRLVHGEYPKSLDALMPQFAEKLPRDLIGGQPLHYRRTADGKFLLYSVGWNEKDDNGSPSRWEDVKHGDWVWQATGQ